MKRLLALLAVVLAGAVAAPAWAAPTKIGGPTGVLMRDYTIQFDATTDDSPAFETVGRCTFKLTKVGTGTVSVYAVATRSTASSSGTSIATLSTDGQSSSTTPPTRWARAVASGTGLSGSILHVECPALSAGGGGNVFDPSLLGGGFDPSTGLYAWTVAGPAWAPAPEFVECDGEASTASGTDGRCWADGEKLLVNDSLEALMLAHDATMPGGTIYVPLWEGEDHAIYVWEECDGETCPLIQQGFSDRRKNQPNRTAFMTATHGRQFVAQASPRVDPVTKRRSGVWLIDNSNDGAASGDWSFRNGLEQVVRYCVPTSTTDPTCNVDSATVAAFDMPSMSLAGVETALTVTSASTSSNNGFPTICTDNTITTDPATTKGVCRGDPRIRCTVAGSSARLTATTGGCDFGAGGDLGPCEGIVDYIENQVEVEGEPVTLAIRFNNFEEDSDSASNGQKTTYMPVESVLDSPTCDTDSQYILLGIEGGADDLSRIWPWDGDELNPANLTVNQVLVADMDALNMGNGYNWSNFGFAPNNYFSRNSSLASADCLVGNEAECDERALIGFMGGIGGGHYNTLYYGCSNDTSKSCIDGQVSAIDTKIHLWESDYLRQGLLADLSRWDFRTGYVHDAATGGGLFNLFVSNAKSGDLVLRNNRVLYAFRTAYGKNVTLSSVIVDGMYAEAGMVLVDSGVGMTVEDFRITGLSGHGFVIGADDEDDTVSNLAIRNVRCTGHCAPTISSGFGERAKSFIAVSQFVVGDNQAQGALENILIDGVQVDSHLVETMLLSLDIGDDNALGGATATNLGQEPYFGEISLTNSSLNSTNGILVGALGSSGTVWDAADVTVDYRDASPRARMKNNRINGTLLEDWDHGSLPAASVGDCQDMTHGSTVAIYDDTAAGACTDADANGQLDGGGSATSVCKCSPAGDSGDGAWSAL